MVRNEQQYHEAIALRRQGLSYREILQKIPIAKSTLSLWLRSVALSRRVAHILSEKKHRAQLRGGLARHRQRVALVHDVFEECAKDIHHLTKRELLLMGVALYWAEGAKEKEAHPGSGVRFANSDPRMIRLFLRWLEFAVHVPKEAIHVSLYIHSSHKERIAEHRKFWAHETGLSLSKFEKVYYKRTRPKTNRSNVGDSYHGVMNIMVRSSSRLLRKVAGWTEAVSRYDWGMV